MQLLFYVALAVIGHALYVALMAKDELQSWHHGREYNPTVVVTGVSMPTAAVIALISVEAILGTAAALYAAVGNSELHPARLAETTKFDRYDRSMYTGIGFSHFNHRGSLAGKNENGLGEGEAPSSAPKDANSKKKD